ncbi:STAS domain-containing protein [Streptomyces virginiae]|uniref:STAS domain-containing protein n=2 Tax=Streptomyces virginiae TaxID=1961 RepID=UPI00367C90F8
MDYRADPPDRLTLLETFMPYPAARIMLLRGVVTAEDAEHLRAAFVRSLTADRFPLIVDLGSLEYADSTLLGLLLAARARTASTLSVPSVPPWTAA